MLIRLILLFLVITQLHAASRGEILFRKAYKTENENPENALKFYRLAISSGIPRSMARAAKWKIYHLLVQTERFPEAYEYLSGFKNNSSTKRMRQNLVKTVRMNWNLSDIHVGKYLALLSELDSDYESSLAGLKDILQSQPDNFALFRRTVEYCKKKKIVGYDNLLPDDFSSYSHLTKLQYLAWFITNQKYEQAQILHSQIEQEEIESPAQNFDYHLLTGKLRSRQSNHMAAIEAYEKAISISGKPLERRRLKYLIALEYYKTADFISAKKALPKKYFSSDKENAWLLRHLIKTRLNCYAALIQELRTYMQQIEIDQVSGVLAEDAALLMKQQCQAIQVQPQDTE